MVAERTVAALMDARLIVPKYSVERSIMLTSVAGVRVLVASSMKLICADSSNFMNFKQIRKIPTGSPLSGS